MRVVAIDQGTTSTRALLFEPDGSCRLLGTRRHRQILPAPGRVEHDPAEILGHVEDLLGLGRGAGATVAALANQGETVVAWDRATGRPIGPAIVWQDQRTSGRIETLRARGLEEEVRERSGLPLDSYFSASKLRWLFDAYPEAPGLARRGRLCLGTSDAFLLHRLTGRFITDATTAARTSLMALDTETWDPRLCEIFGVRPDLLPEIVDGAGSLGEVSGGLVIGASVVDQIAALFGHGCRRPGDAKVTFGTGAFALAVTGARSRRKGVVDTLGWREGGRRLHVADGGVYSAGAAVEWLIRLGLLDRAGDLDLLSGPPAVARGVVFVPALSGLACPHWDRSAAGLWIGLDAATGRADLQKAVIEGVAFRVAEALDALGNDAAGLLSVDGGLSRCSYFLSFLAALLGRGMRVPALADLTALGAARLAAGLVAAPPADGHVVAPDAAGAAPASWREAFARARQRAAGWRDGADLR